MVIIRNGFEKLKPQKITTLDIEIAIARRFDARRNLIVPNVSYGAGLHECDILIITSSGYATEIEIKISLSDLIADKKKAHNHGIPDGKHFLMPYNHEDKIKYLYFAIPEKLKNYIEHIPKQAGIFIVSEGGFVKCIKEPIKKSKYQFSEQERFNVARLGTMRIWNLKSKIRELKNAIQHRRINETQNTAS